MKLVSIISIIAVILLAYRIYSEFKFREEERIHHAKVEGMLTNIKENLN